MTHPIFHPGETCYVHFPTSSGWQYTECEVTGLIPRGQGRYAYRVRLQGASRDCVFEQGDLSKRWERSDWGMLRGIFQPRRQAR
jgi:hypothetical protein